MPVRIHDLRHIYGTMAYEKTGEVKAVQNLMNHQNNASTKIYLHMREVRRKRNALAVGAAMHEKTRRDAQ